MNFFDLIILILQLSFFGIFVAFNPMLLLSQFLVILQSKKPLIHTIIFVAGASLPLIIIAAIGAIVFQEDTSVRSFGSELKLSPFLNILIGIIMVLISIRLFFGDNASSDSKSSAKANHNKIGSSNMSLWALFWFAFFRSAVSFTSIIGIVAATKVIKEYTDNYLIILLGLFWTITVGMLPFVGILSYSLRRPNDIKNIEQKIDPLLNKNYKGSVKWLLLIGGIYFIVKAII